MVAEEFPDHGDACFLEVAQEAGVPLVTGNARHFPDESRGGVEVLLAREFLDRMK